MTGTTPSAAPAGEATPPPPGRCAEDGPSIAAQLCWHAAAICHALDRAVAELQAALAEAAERTDAVIELAIVLAGEGDAPPAELDLPGGHQGPASARVDPPTEHQHVEGARA